jgi:hypothetical protein
MGSTGFPAWTKTIFVGDYDFRTKSVDLDIELRNPRKHRGLEMF